MIKDIGREGLLVNYYYIETIQWLIVMEKRNLGKTGLKIVPLVFGGNVFGWTLNEKQSFELLDAIVDQGLNAIDTSDNYSHWVPQNKGGESETIIGKWIKANSSKREKIYIFTKVGGGMKGPKKGLSRKWIMQAVEDSLRRLQIDVIDLYQSHWPDPNTAYEETLSAYAQLLKEGKIRAIGASNLNVQQLSDSLHVAKEHHLPAYQTLQPEYNLYDQQQFDPALRNLVLKEDIGVITYYSLASGFLTGKYRNQENVQKSARNDKIVTYMNDRGMRILRVLDKIAADHQVSQSAVALAWLQAQKEVTAPIASATHVSQLKDLIRSLTLKLSSEELTELDQASAI